jgi:hypothetical protein
MSAAIFRSGIRRTSARDPRRLLPPRVDSLAGTRDRHRPDSPARGSQPLKLHRWADDAGRIQRLLHEPRRPGVRARDGADVRPIQRFSTLPANGGVLPLPLAQRRCGGEITATVLRAAAPCRFSGRFRSNCPVDCCASRALPRVCHRRNLRIRPPITSAT